MLVQSNVNNLSRMWSTKAEQHTCRAVHSHVKQEDIAETLPPSPEDRRSIGGRYASYWNAYLLMY